MTSQAVAAIIEDQDGKFLLHLRDEKAPTMKNQWCLVGGGIEKNETPEEAITREVQEETGLTIIKTPELFEQFARRDKPQQVFIFHVQVDTWKQNLKLGEGREIKFFTSKEIIQLVGEIDYSNQFLETMVNFIQKEKKENAQT